MNWKTLALGFAMTGLAACGNPPPTGDGGTGGTDTGPVTTPVTRTYILSMLDSGEDLSLDPPPQAYGYDLDMMDGGPTGTCQDQMDYTSPISMSGGVDNQLSGLLPTLGMLAGGGTANDLLNSQVRKGTVLLVIQVSDINSFANDSSVMVHTSLATLSNTAACVAYTDMAMCTADTANHCNWYAGGDGACIPMMVDSTGAIAAGQTFMAGTSLGDVSGSITAGRLTAIATTLPLTFDIGGMTISVNLNNLHLGAAISDTGGLTNGEFGASLAVIDLIHVAQMTSLAMGMSDDEVRGLLEGFVSPDLAPDSMGTCQSISAGFGFSGVAAVVP